ncbi:MAG: DUF5719 family protein [Bifidobacteriaceae bacterium]|jgi:hypothetical protein|nr:DUF5719 family protein [Bifidobacteriaceae bacterium]
MRNRNIILASLAIPIIAVLIAVSIFAPFDIPTQNYPSDYNIDTLSQQTICSGVAQLPDKSELDGADPSFNPMPEKPNFQTVVTTSGSVIFGSLFNLNQTNEIKLAKSDISYLSTNQTDPKLLATEFGTTSNIMGSAGVSSSIINKGDLKGLAVDSCQKPAMEKWLIGGNSHIKSAPVLIINNPSLSSGTVSLDVYTNNSSNSPFPYSATREISVSGYSQKRIFLSSGALNQDILAVHTKFYGAAMTASMQYSELDGIVSQGIDYISPSYPPAKQQIISGIHLKDKEPLELNLLSLSNGSANLEFIKYDKSSNTSENIKNLDIDLLNSKVSQTSISDLPNGNYAVVIKSQNNLIASARVTNSSDGQKDFTYYSTDNPAINLVGILPSSVKADIVVYPEGGNVNIPFVFSLYSSKGKLVSQKTYSGKNIYHFSAEDIDKIKKTSKQDVQFIFINSQDVNTKFYAGMNLSMADSSKNNSYFISSQSFMNLDTFTQKVSLQVN